MSVIDGVTAAGQAYSLTNLMMKKGNAGKAATEATHQINEAALQYKATAKTADPQFDEVAHGLMTNACGYKPNPDCITNNKEAVAAKTQKILQSYVNTNRVNEDAAQQGAVTATGIALASTAAAITGHVQQRMADQAQAKALSDYANAAQGNFTFSPETPVPYTDGSVNNAAPVPNSVVAAPAADTGLPGNVPLVNPNLEGGGVNAPAPNPFVSSAAPAAGGGAGSYGGSAGGTSAAKGDAAGAQEAAAKAQSGGNYASGDSSTPRFSRSGDGGGGVGLDGAFADLLKKFQPDDKKDNSASMVFGEDRSPASDRNAVLRQDQNIFEAVSKRTQIKVQQGAVSFGDQT